ncbi:MAG TPA: tellurite resistance TerB C-terminal domain-containing protein [Nostocaceae cyanobacterium]|nr:tellurite resistance TerB C-terminal domain-containing protein [Nostocaceae cyanobacterium]
MKLITNSSNHLITLKTNKMQPVIVSNRLILGIVAFSVSFGLSLVPNWDFTKAFVTAIVTVIATYSAAIVVDKRRRNQEMLVLSSLHRKIREMEGLKSRIIRELKQLDEHSNNLYTESQKLQNQILDSRNQRDSLQRELGTFAAQKKQLEAEINGLKAEVKNLERNSEELNNTCSNLTSEKRRLELNCNVSRAEINQLQNQIEELQQAKQEAESNITLLGRLKPQLEEKLYELRLEIHELETEVIKQNQLLANTKSTRENLENSLNSLQLQTTTRQTELNQIQSQIYLLQDERDLLQNQVWELLQQMETLNQEVAEDIEPEGEIESFPFDELLEPFKPATYAQNNTENLPTEWTNFLEHLPAYEIQVLKAIVEQDNPKAKIKQIAEANITMPNLLIDSINEIANNTLGELIIATESENPEISPEHILNVQKIITLYDNLKTKSASSN